MTTKESKRGRPKKEKVEEEVKPFQVTENLYMGFDDRNVIIYNRKVKGEGEKRGRGVKEENIGEEYFVFEAAFAKYYGINYALKYCVAHESFLNVSGIESILYNQEKLFKFIDTNFKSLVKFDESMRIEEEVAKKEEALKNPVEKKKQRKSSKKKVHKTISGEKY